EGRSAHAGSIRTFNRRSDAKNHRTVRRCENLPHPARPVTRRQLHRIGAVSLDLEPAVTLPWLIRLRWAFLAGQLAIAPIMNAWFGLPVDVGLLAIQLGLMIATNIALIVIQRRRGPSSRVIGAVMVVDTLLLTLFLYACGGSANPFTVLYLVHIAL